MDKPKEALERIKTWGPFEGDTVPAILAWADSIPDDAHICQWPKELTRERLYMLAANRDCQEKEDALRALAAIDKKKKRRMVNLWQHHKTILPDAYLVGFDPNGDDQDKEWRKVGGPFEIEE